jgi:hypothetical protein
MKDARNTRGGNPDDLFFVTLQSCITGSIQHFRLNFDFSLPSPMEWAPDLKATAATSQFETNSVASGKTEGLGSLDQTLP